MSQLDEVSRAIGSMQSSIETLATAHADKAQKDEAFRRFVYDKLNKVDGLAADTARAHARLDTVEQVATGSAKTISRVKWIASGFALAGSVVGAKIGQFLGLIDHK